MRDDAPDEKDWAEELAHGGTEALGRLYDAYAPRLYAYARALGAPPAEAEDILHEVFVALVRRPPRPGHVRSWRAFLFVATRHEFYRLGRRLLRKREVGLEGMAETLEALSGGSAESAHAVEEALAGLPRAQREVVVMKVFGGLTFEEIGEATGTTINTAASRYRYAIEKLKRTMEK